jgi:hypothetical protein
VPFAQSPTDQMQLDFSCSASKSTWSALLARSSSANSGASMSRSRLATDFCSKQTRRNLRRSVATSRIQTE